MNKKISLGLAIALIILSATATFAITMSVSQRMYNKLITDLPNARRCMMRSRRSTRSSALSITAI